MSADVFFEDGERTEVTRVLDRDTRIAAAALICALALSAAAASAGQSASGASLGGVPSVGSNAPAVFGLPAAPPVAASSGVHTTSGAS